MKKIYLLGVMIMMSASFCLAQTEQGKWIVTGRTALDFTHSISNQKYKGEKLGSSSENRFSISPGVGYFVADNLAVGLSSAFSTTTAKEANMSETSFNVFPGVFYYFPTNSQLRPFAEAGIGYAHFASTQADSTMRFGGLGFGGSLGLSYFISKQISLDLMGQYINTNLKDRSNKDISIQGNAISAMIGFSLFL